MARLSRLAIAGHLHHVLQRGAHGQLICTDPDDYAALLDTVHDAAQQHQVAVHGYVLLPDHFHLLLTPPEDRSLPLMMQAIGRAYVRYFNAKHQRRGTLWEGRFKSAVLQPRYAIPALTFLDTHAQRAGSSLPFAEYRWSSYSHYSGAQVQKRIVTHPAYWALGNTPFAREAAYQAAVQDGLNTVQLHEHTDAVTRGWALGDDDFVAEIQKNTARRLSRKTPGRPRRSTSNE
jgi:putative transposase